MELPLDSLIQLAQFTSGRRIFAFQQARKVALEFGDTALVQRLDKAIAHDRETRMLDNQWHGNRSQPIYAPELPELDNWEDQLITAIRSHAQRHIGGAFAGTEVEAYAKQLIDALFKKGVQPITSLPYVEQVAAVEAMLEQLHGKLAPAVAALGLTSMVQRLTELNAQYRAALDKTPEPLEFATVLAQRKRGQRNLLEVTAIILGKYPSHDDPQHISRRVALMKPILDQDRRIRALRSARRNVPDIDPDAGPDAPGEPGGEIDGAPDDQTPPDDNGNE